jgi:hypothetical protein
MPTFTYTLRGRSLVRSTLILLTVTSAGYVAGAFLHPGSSRDVSAAFAAPVQAAESNFRDSLITSSFVARPAAEEWSRIPEPRECDLAGGISSACLFMD